MRMTTLDLARRIVLGAYARRHGDVLTLAVLQSLERENAGLRSAVAERRRQGRARNGRRVFGLTVSASILLVGLAAFGYWYRDKTSTDDVRVVEAKP